MTVLAYNAVGNPTSYTDPNGTKHTYAYDILGRQVSDSITTFGSTGVAGVSISNSIIALTTAYDGLGNPVVFTSVNSSGGVQNQVKDVYNGLGQLATEYQSIQGPIGSLTLFVSYVYVTPYSGQNYDIQTGLVYPNGRTLLYLYNGLDLAIGRVSALADSTSSTLESYTYLGLGTIVQRAHPQTNINLTYLNSTVITGNRYVGLDPFGRVIDQNWVKASTGVSTDHFQYGYDRTDNALYKNNLVTPANSELYRGNGAASGDSNTAYDPLGRLTNFARGTLTASSYNGGQLDTIAAASQTISFGLDALGNTTSKVSNGSTLSRTFNAQNQEASNSASTSALYDHDGNEVKNEGRGTIYAYDAWNRLSSVVTSGGTALAGYNYDALGRRNEWYPFIAFAGGTLNIFSYYSAAGQVLEDRWATSTPLAPSAIFQNVWSEAYVNAMVLRDQDYTNNTLYQRLYAQQDANWNTTAVTDTAGTVQERFEYDPYGNMTVLNAAGTATGGGSTTGWRYFFQGGRLDFATGWYLFGARDYNPAEGRWAERDPLGQAADLNVYRFTGNNPVGMVDPSGLVGERYYGQSIAEGAWWAWDVGFAAQMGAWQGTANVVNSVTDAGIGVLNLPATFANSQIRAGNSLFGGSVRPFSYIPSPDWSNGLFTYENSFDRKLSRGAGDVAVLAASMALGVGPAMGPQVFSLPAPTLMTTLGFAVPQAGAISVSTSQAAGALGVGSMLFAKPVRPDGGSGEPGNPSTEGPNFTKEMLSQSETIARGREIRKVDDLVDKFGGTRKGWVKKKGWDSSGQEWHWYEHNGIGRVGAILKGSVDPL